MNAPSSRSSWIKWLLLGLLVIGIALGVARARTSSRPSRTPTIACGTT